MSSEAFEKIISDEKEHATNECLDKALDNTRKWIAKHEGYNECQQGTLSHLIDVLIDEQPQYAPTVAMFAAAMMRLIEAEQ